jgi:hypothetical protein
MGVAAAHRRHGRVHDVPGCLKARLTEVQSRDVFVRGNVDTGDPLATEPTRRRLAWAQERTSMTNPGHGTIVKPRFVGPGQGHRVIGTPGRLRTGNGPGTPTEARCWAVSSTPAVS